MLFAAGSLGCWGESPAPVRPDAAPPDRDPPPAAAPAPVPEERAAAQEPAPPTAAQVADREADAGDREREAAVRERLIGNGDDPEFQAELRSRLQSGYAADREEALVWVDATRETIPVMVEILLNDPAPEVRAQAAESLTDVRSHEAVAGLIQALDDPDSRVVVKAISGIGATGDGTLLPRLAPLLDDPDLEVRQAALQAMEVLD